MSSNPIRTNGCTGPAVNISKNDFKQDFEEIRIPVPWGHIAGKWWGSKDVQPVLAVHGWQDNAGTFDTLAPYLVAKGISLLCIDLPGHGYSSHLPKGLCYYIFWDGVQHVRRIVKYYNWASVTILGHSLGGGIAFLYAAIYPNEIDKYVSIDIAAPVIRETSIHLNRLGSNIDRLFKLENLTKQSQPCYNYEEMLGIVEDAYGGECTRESCKILMRRGMQAQNPEYPEDDDQTYCFTRDVRLKVPGWAMMDLQQALDYAKAIKCEVLNIRANPGMHFDHPEHYKAIVDKIREHAVRAEFFVVPGTHHVHLNNPESISEIVIDFLKS